MIAKCTGLKGYDGPHVIGKAHPVHFNVYKCKLCGHWFKEFDDNVKQRHVRPMHDEPSSFQQVQALEHRRLAIMTAVVLLIVAGLLWWAAVR